MRRGLAGIAALAMLGVPSGPAAAGQTKRLEQGSQRIELTLERQESGTWRPVDPGLVFDSGDRVRFRFRSNFDGYLYVMNQATSGKYETLFRARIPGTRTVSRRARSTWFRPRKAGSGSPDLPDTMSCTGL